MQAHSLRTYVGYCHQLMDNQQLCYVLDIVTRIYIHAHIRLSRHDSCFLPSFDASRFLNFLLREGERKGKGDVVIRFLSIPPSLLHSTLCHIIIVCILFLF